MPFDKSPLPLYIHLGHVERELDRLLLGAWKCPPPGFGEHARRLSGPDHIKTFQHVLTLVGDPFARQSGQVYALYEWARYFLQIERSQWNEIATLPADFGDRWWNVAIVPRGNSGFSIEPLSVVRERRRDLLIEAGLLKVDTAVAPAPAAPGTEPLAWTAPTPADKALAASGNEDRNDPPHPAELPELVTLDQAAALVNRVGRTLERYKKRGMPKPFVRGGGGKPHEYRWSEMRAFLEKTFDRPIPDTEIQKFRHPKLTDTDRH